MRGRPHLHVAAWLAACLAGVLGCGAPERAAPPDRGTACADVHDVRVCWECDGAEPCLVPRFTPPSRPPAGWRCVGGGPQRTCADRAATAGPFHCQGDRCEQRHPRFPDDGEWECADLSGVVICHGGQPAAAVAAGPSDPGWLCGPRPGERGPERVCVDFAPDRPGGDAHGWSCSYERQRGQQRICQRSTAPELGSPCAGGCPEGARCTGDRCVPPRPQPACWFDRDCASGRCRFGSCA